MPHGAIDIRVTSPDLAALFKQAKAFDGILQVELRRGIKSAADPIVAGIKAEASGFSTRIPGAVRAKASFAKRGASVVVIVNSRTAPHAAPINHHDAGGRFRHPVYGHRSTWVSQAAHPFMTAGARKGQAAADVAMLRVMDAVAAKMGFH